MGKQTVYFDYVNKNIRQLNGVKDLTLIKGYPYV